MSHKCEVVHVLTSESLIDSESYEHRYEAQHVMTPGFYVVVWPTSGSRRFDCRARFIGPYPGRADAERVVEGRIDDADLVPAFS
jgi:hypothetical protein